MKKTYHKLVRDRIPEIIMKLGNTGTTEVLSDEDYLKMLDAKLDEELAEYHKEQNIEELADLLEVVRACAVARGYSVEQLEQVRAQKASDRGGFEKRILLNEVDELSKKTPIYRKKVDWSVFKDGFAIPLDVQSVLQQIPELATVPGEVRDVTLIIAGHSCPATLRNLPIDNEKNPNHSPIVQIRYKSTDEVADCFRNVFSETWQEMCYEKQYTPSKKHIQSENGDFFTMYTTDKATTFIVECHIAGRG